LHVKFAGNTLFKTPAMCYSNATKKHMAATSTGQTKSAASALTNRQRFLDACRCKVVDRPPVWLMRQAGRALPEYRKLKEKYSFLELVQTPELAAEVTLQPIHRFDFDAAILFSDILVVAEGLGQKYRFDENNGVQMDFALRSAADIARLDVNALGERLQYVPRALKLVKNALGDRTALIGFAGSPWTLATFMMEGGRAERYTRALTLFRGDRKTFYALAEKLTVAITTYLQMQITAGADVLQIFDSHGGQLAPTEFQEASGRWMKEIIAALKGRAGSPLPAAGTRSDDGAHGLSRHSRATAEVTRPTSVPIIVFSPGTHGNWDDLLTTGANVLGVDWQFPLAQARRLLPGNIGLQGNLAPTLLSDSTPEVVAAETSLLLENMRGRKGYIFNLGHGVPPGAKLENIAALVKTVRNFK
jgi:uroporphyrinogen decarboxylase